MGRDALLDGDELDARELLRPLGAARAPVLDGLALDDGRALERGAPREDEDRAGALLPNAIVCCEFRPVEAAPLVAVKPRTDVVGSAASNGLPAISTART